MRLLRRSLRPRVRADRAGERYIAMGAEEARRVGVTYVGTEHVLLALTRNPKSGAATVLRRLGVTHDDVKDSPLLARLWAPRIDRDALASLGIDLDVVRERLEAAFGPRALEEGRAGMLEPIRADVHCIAPRLKQALEHAADRAGDRPFRDEDVLLGMLAVDDSLAARALAELGVTREAAEALVHDDPG